MATNLDLDDKLVEQARRSGSHKTKKEAVTVALEEYIRRHQQQKIMPSSGLSILTLPMITNEPGANDAHDGTGGNAGVVPGSQASTSSS